jgi:hypothetical protein
VGFSGTVSKDIADLSSKVSFGISFGISGSVERDFSFSKDSKDSGDILQISKMTVRFTGSLVSLMIIPIRAQD